ncbi:MAG: hypothetical protein U0136_22215 [Bdellovibrionota bacterium]
MNYPAKYFTAEDHMRLRHVLMPLISVVIAFTPQSSCEQLIALYEAGRLELVTVGSDSTVEPQTSGGIVYYYGPDANNSSGGTKPIKVRFETFVDCVGQRQLSFDEFPFESLKSENKVAPATLQFRSALQAAKWLEAGEKVEGDAASGYTLTLPGVAIGDNFEAVNREGIRSERLFIMAVPLIGGYNPDYSGLDFCEDAARKIARKIIGRGESA